MDHASYDNKQELDTPQTLTEASASGSIDDSEFISKANRLSLSTQYFHSENDQRSQEDPSTVSKAPVYAFNPAALEFVMLDRERSQIWESLAILEEQWLKQEELLKLRMETHSFIFSIIPQKRLLNYSKCKCLKKSLSELAMSFLI